MNIHDMADLQVVARTIWGEARGEGILGMQAVGCVINNRYHMGSWFGRSPRDVCLKPFQFSCWNTKDPNRQKLLNLDEADSEYVIAQDIARTVLDDSIIDITDMADSYQVMGTNAYWARNLMPCKIIGHHEFYRTMGTA